MKKKNSLQDFLKHPLSQIIAFVVVFMNYLADVVTQYIDPRVRLD